MIREYIQNIIEESIENARAKEIEILKNMLQTSYYKIQTGKNIDHNETKFEYAKRALTNVHNFTSNDIDSILEPTKHKLKDEHERAERREREEREKQRQREKERERQHSQSGSILCLITNSMQFLIIFSVIFFVSKFTSSILLILDIISLYPDILQSLSCGK